MPNWPAFACINPPQEAGEEEARDDVSCAHATIIITRSPQQTERLSAPQPPDKQPVVTEHCQQARTENTCLLFAYPLPPLQALQEDYTTAAACV